jgi:hypothetical protein
MWYFQFNNQQNGPNDSQVIKALLAKQTLSRDTLVWKEGMSDWQRLADTELALLIPINLPPPINPPEVQRAVVQPPPIHPVGNQPLPGQAKITQLREDQSASLFPEYFKTPHGIKSMWLWSMILLVVGFGLIMYGAMVGLSDNGFYLEYQGALIFGSLIVAGGAILWWMLLYKSWEIIQDGNPATTPGKAVGFMFIPIFNYYWQFVAILGLARQLNRYCAERGVAAKRVDEQLTLAQCVLFCTLWIPYLNILTGIVFAVIFFIVWKSIAETVALIVTSKSQSTTY